MIDQDGDGLISKNDLAGMLDNLGQQPTKALLESYQIGEKGVNFTQFLTMFGEHLAELDEEKLLLEAFECFDERDEGKIDVGELKYWLSEVGDRMSEKEVCPIPIPILLVYHTFKDHKGLLKLGPSFFTIHRLTASFLAPSPTARAATLTTRPVSDCASLESHPHACLLTDTTCIGSSQSSRQSKCQSPPSSSKTRCSILIAAHLKPYTYIPDRPGTDSLYFSFSLASPTSCILSLSVRCARFRLDPHRGRDEQVSKFYTIDYSTHYITVSEHVSVALLAGAFYVDKLAVTPAFSLQARRFGPWSRVAASS